MTYEQYKQHQRDKFVLESKDIALHQAAYEVASVKWPKAKGQFVFHFRNEFVEVRLKSHRTTLLEYLGNLNILDVLPKVENVT